MRSEASCRKPRGLALHRQSQVCLEPEFGSVFLMEESTPPKPRLGLFCLQSGIEECKAAKPSRIDSPAAPSR